MTADNQAIATLQAENTALRQENQRLSERVAALEQECKAIRAAQSQTANTTETALTHHNPTAQQREAERLISEMRQSQVLLQGVIDNIPSVIYAKTLEGQIILANRYWAASLGMEPDQVVGRYDSEFAAPDTIDEWRTMTSHITATGKPIQREEPFTLPDGVHTYLSMLFPLYDDQGKIHALGGLATDITERKQIEQQLEENRSMLRLVIDHLPQTVFWKDRDLRYLGCNMQFARDAGAASPDEVVGKTDLEMPWIELAEAFRADDQAVMESGTARIDYEEPLVRADGSQGWVRTSKIPLHRDNDVFAVMGMYEDISERKQQEKELYIFRFALDNLAHGVQLLNRDGHHIYVNQAMCSQLGYSEEELLQIKLDQIDVDLELEQWQRKVWPMIQELGTVTFEARHRRRDGSILPVEVTGSYLAFQDQELLFAFARDISERKQAEAQVRRFSDILQTTPEALATITIPDGKLEYVNRAYSHLLGYTLDELQGSRVHDIFAEPPEVVQEAFEHCIKHGSWRGELLSRAKNGEAIPTLISSHVLYCSDGQPQVVSGFLRDLREQKQQEAERAALQQQIIDAQRNALRELSTPLIPISHDVVIMPLIGTIDSGRAQQVLETLLEGVAHYQADLAILDITGVSMVDTQVAQALVSAAQAVRLLGARVMLTGIQPQIAQTLVHLGVDLGTIVTRGSLQAGIADALKQQT
jgi:rsbT co-antagonist protein RsbR